MTKTYKEITTTTPRIEKKLTGITCDWCNCDIPTKRKQYTTTPETKIQFNRVHNCYEDTGGYGWAIEDLCLECGNKLEILLKQAGITVHEYEW